MPETPEILLKAADVIDERGWTQGSYVGPLEIGQSINDGCVCVRGAINVAAGLPPNGRRDQVTAEVKLAYDAALILANWLQARGVLKQYESLAEDWNDRPSRTAEQVTAALRECAAELAKGATS